MTAVDNRPAADLDPAASRSFAWLTGLLEAEGTFLKPPPSSPRQPVVRCSTTDRDVVERVAAMFGTTVLAIDKGRYRTEYAATIKGSRAVELMRDLRPGMGCRRRAAIDAAVSLHVAPERKLSFEKAEAIRAAYASGRSISSLARQYGVRCATIRPVLKRVIYPEPVSCQWRTEQPWLPRALDTADVGIDPIEFSWLAGWLEGEGSFLRPPPSDPRRPRISAQCCDHDVIERAARLLRISAQPKHDCRARAPGMVPTVSCRQAGQPRDRLHDQAGAAHGRSPTESDHGRARCRRGKIWRRRESNADPQSRTNSVYRYSRRLNLAPRGPRRRARPWSTTSEVVPGRRRRAFRASPLLTPEPHPTGRGWADAHRLGSS